MKKIIWGFFCALFLTGFAKPLVSAETMISAEARAAEELSLYAAAAVLMDADSGRVLYGKNADEPMAMASTTKIMTCIVVLENVADREETASVSAYAAGMPKVKLCVSRGETYKIKDLLYSLMLESHNDSAVVLAEFVGKQYLPEELKAKDTAEYTPEESRQAVAAFAALMNRKAAELGCENTWYITPNGLDAEEEVAQAEGTVRKEHGTTAAELARVMAYCLKESPEAEEFLKITRTGSYSFAANGRSFSCVNHNSFLSMMNGALSGKTGFTNKAGYCYVGALERDGRTFVVALLACGWPNHKTYKWSDTRELMQYGIDNYFYRSFREEGVALDEALLKAIPVLEGQTDILGKTAYTDIRIEGRGAGLDAGMDTLAGGDGEEAEEGVLMRPDETIRVEYHVEDSLVAPVKAGTLVGSVEYSVDGVVYLRESIVTADTVEKIDFTWCLRQILRRFLWVEEGTE